MRTIGRSLHKLLKPLAQKSGFADGRIFSQWGQIVGEEIAKKARPQKLSNGTLTLSVSNGAVAMEIQHQAMHLMERINRHFGYKAVKSLRPVQTYMELEPALQTQAQTQVPTPDKGAQVRAEAQTRTVRDETLRAALTRLGSYIEMQNSKSKTS